MALSAISSISSVSPLQLARGSRITALEAAPIEGVRAIPALAVREDTPREDSRRKDGGAESARPRDVGKLPGASASQARRPALDPRGADIILGRVAAEKNKERAQADEKKAEAGGRDPRSRLDELLGQQASQKARQTQAKSAQNAQVVAQLSQLRARDSAVRAHEAAHMAAGGRYVTGGASYSYQKGPDGAQYAIGGEVGIDTSSVPGKPEETVQKMRTIRAAALAPSDPSAADISVAAGAAQIEAQALAEIAQARAQEFAGRYAQGPGSTRGAQTGGGGESGAGASRREPINMVA